MNNFKSFPETSGMLNSDGQQELSIGATRAAIGDNQVAGSYSASFVVAVVY